MLSVCFFNREGHREQIVIPKDSCVHNDTHSFFKKTHNHYELKTGITVACAQLRRTLFETGQLFVTTEDGLSRICFSGIGDSGRLFVEVTPRDHRPEDEGTHHFIGCMCSLADGEAILTRIYGGATSAWLEKKLIQMRKHTRSEAFAA